MHVRSTQFFKYHLCAIAVLVVLFMYLPSGIVAMISDAGRLRRILICVPVSWLIDSVCRLWVFPPVAHHRAGLPNTMGLFSSTNAERFPALPRWPTSSCMELGGVRALAPHLLQRFVSHLPSVFLGRLVLLIKVGHGRCQQWVNAVVSETLQSFSCCLRRAYPAAAGNACPWW